MFNLHKLNCGNSGTNPTLLMPQIQQQTCLRMNNLKKLILAMFSYISLEKYYNVLAILSHVRSKSSASKYIFLQSKMSSLRQVSICVSLHASDKLLSMLVQYFLARNTFTRVKSLRLKPTQWLSTESTPTYHRHPVIEDEINYYYYQRSRIVEVLLSTL